MTKRTYNSEDYEPETRAAMKDMFLNASAWRPRVASDMVEIADIIEKAVVEAKKVTEEKVRAACAAVAEVHLNKKGRTK